MLIPYTDQNRVLPRGSLHMFMCNDDMKERLVVDAFCDRTSRVFGSPRYKIQVRPALLLLAGGRRGADVRVKPALLPDRSALVVRWPR